MPRILVDSATDGTSLVAAPGANRKIRVNGFSLSAAGAVTATLKDGAAGSAVWKGTMATGVPHTLPPKADWEVILTANTALVLGLSGAVNVSGVLDYSIIVVGA